MFIGREKELQKLNALYDDSTFQFVIMYGRRRIGKTELLKEFSKTKNVIFYSALEGTDNLGDFSDIVLKHFGEKSSMTFSSWKDSFSYIADHSNERTVLIIDEFPYIAKYEPEVKSILQHMIDHRFKDENIMIILCGSSVSFMVNEVMGEKSPLYARNTAVMEILPFDYTMVEKFLPGYSKENQMLVYSILGGVPYYLSKFRDSKTLAENIADTIIESGAILREEPSVLLKAELREPAVYNSILTAISSGSVKLTEIAEKAKMDATQLPVYLKNLMEMRLIDKIICCGEKENSKKSQYRIKDNFFSFWYRFIFKNQTEIELTDSRQYAESIMNEIREYAGFKFEEICLQYMRRTARCGGLPFIPKNLGKWWGTNQLTKQHDDIDILAIRDFDYIFCECKFKNEAFNLKEFNDLITSSTNFKNCNNKYYYVFIKSQFTPQVIEEAKKYNTKLITINEM